MSSQELVVSVKPKWGHFLCIYPYASKAGLTYEDLHPPLGMEYVAAAAGGLVDKVTMVDMRYERRPLERLLAQADIIGFSILWRHQKKIAYQLIDLVPLRATVIFGGIQPSQFPDEYLKSFPRLDIVVRGDGEETTREILSGRRLSEIKGISYRRNGEIIHNEPRPYARVLDFYPDRRQRCYRYEYHLWGGLNLSLDCVLSSRGCSYRCEYCTFRLDPAGQKRPWSGRSPESVVEEVKSTKSDIILFSDDDFGQSASRVEKICELIRAQGIRKGFGCEMRVDIARRPDVLLKMRRAGFWGISFGIESCQDKTLRRIRKGLTIRKIEESFETLRRFDIFYVGYFIIGYVGESPADILEIPGFARRLGLDFIGVSLLRAFPQLPLREELERDPQYHIDQDDVVLYRNISREDLEFLCRTVVRRFYSPAQVLRILRKFLFGGIPKRLFLKFMLGLWLCEFLGRRLGLRLGYPR